MPFEIWKPVVEAVSHHPLLAGGSLFLVVLIIPLGAMKTLRIFGSFLVILIREFKHEVLGMARVLAEVKREATTWKLDD